MARRHGARRARGRRGCHHIEAVEQHQQRLGLDAVDEQLADARRSPRPLDRFSTPVNRRQQAVGQPVRQFPDPADVLAASLVQLAERGTQRSDACRVVRAAAPISLLAAAELLCRQRHAGPESKNPHALGPAELVAAQRQQICRQRRCSDIDPVDPLHRVGVQQRLGGMAPDHIVHGPEIGYDARLVVDQHHRHQSHRRARIGRQLCSQVVEVDLAAGADLHVPAADRRDGVQHRVVFGCRTQRRRACCGGDAVHREIVCFSPAAGEHDAVRVESERPGNDLTCVVDGCARPAGHAVRSRRIGEQLLQVRRHGLDGAPTHRRRRSAVEVRRAIPISGHTLRLRARPVASCRPLHAVNTAASAAAPDAV